MCVCIYIEREIEREREITNRTIISQILRLHALTWRLSATTTTTTNNNDDNDNNNDNINNSNDNTNNNSNNTLYLL